MKEEALMNSFAIEAGLENLFGIELRFCVDGKVRHSVNIFMEDYYDYLVKQTDAFFSQKESIPVTITLEDDEGVLTIQLVSIDMESYKDFYEYSGEPLMAISLRYLKKSTEKKSYKQITCIKRKVEREFQILLGKAKPEDFKSEMDEEKRELERLKAEVISSLIGNELKKEKENVEVIERLKNVELKKMPSEYFIRYFNHEEDYEVEVMNQCEKFHEKYGKYPNILMASRKTFDNWEKDIENRIMTAMAEDENYESYDVEEQGVCEYGPSDDFERTVFRTDKYVLNIVENEEFQEDVYEILDGYSPVLEDSGSFTYPVMDMEATGKNIKRLAQERKITAQMIQKVLNLGSFQAVYKWFNGQSLPTVDNLAVLSNLLNVPIDEIIVVDNQKRNVEE